MIPFPSPQLLSMKPKITKHHFLNITWPPFSVYPTTIILVQISWGKNPFVSVCIKSHCALRGLVDKANLKLGMVEHNYNPNYLRNRDKRFQMRVLLSEFKANIANL